MPVNVKPKYKNCKAEIDGIVFDSKREAERYRKLKLMQFSGMISGLELQKEFELIPKQKGERAVKYRCDFYYLKDGNPIVEDVKGMKTKDYIIKRKLMLFIHGIRVIEI